MKLKFVFLKLLLIARDTFGRNVYQFFFFYFSRDANFCIEKRKRREIFNIRNLDREFIIVGSRVRKCSPYESNSHEKKRV